VEKSEIGRKGGWVRTGCLLLLTLMQWRMCVDAVGKWSERVRSVWGLACYVCVCVVVVVKGNVYGLICAGQSSKMKGG
jgi:hypothetical protein